MGAWPDAGPGAAPGAGLGAAPGAGVGAGLGVAPGGGLTGGRAAVRAAVVVTISTGGSDGGTARKTPTTRRLRIRVRRGSSGKIVTGRKSPGTVAKPSASSLLITTPLGSAASPLTPCPVSRFSGAVAAWV